MLHYTTMSIILNMYEHKKPFFLIFMFFPDEYTKITTPRQDVLFKKGYLSQKKPQSSVDSTSTTTTPSASNNGTPDTQSTNGINSGESAVFN